MDYFILEDAAVSLLENGLVDELYGSIDDILAEDGGDIDSIAMITPQDVEDCDYDIEAEQQELGISSMDDFDSDMADAYKSEPDDIIYAIDEPDEEDDIEAIKAALEDDDEEV